MQDYSIKHMNQDINQPEPIVLQNIPLPISPIGEGKKPKTIIIVIFVVVLILIVGGLGWYFLRTKPVSTGNLQINNQVNNNLTTMPTDLKSQFITNVALIPSRVLASEAEKIKVELLIFFKRIPCPPLETEATEFTLKKEALFTS